MSELLQDPSSTVPVLLVVGIVLTFIGERLINFTKEICHGD